MEVTTLPTLPAEIVDIIIKYASKDDDNVATLKMCCKKYNLYLRYNVRYINVAFNQPSCINNYYNISGNKVLHMHNHYWHIWITEFIHIGILGMEIKNYGIRIMNKYIRYQYHTTAKKWGTNFESFDTSSYWRKTVIRMIPDMQHRMYKCIVTIHNTGELLFKINAAKDKITSFQLRKIKY